MNHTIHSSLHLLISTIISIFGILLAATWPAEKRCEAYFILLYVRAAFWLVTFVWYLICCGNSTRSHCFSLQLFDYIVKYHHEQLRLNGYHDFSKATESHKSIPLQIVSLWNTVILAVSAGMQHYYGDLFVEKCVASYLSPLVYIVAFTVVETLIFFIVHGLYINRVLKFNSGSSLSFIKKKQTCFFIIAAKMPPDALQGINTVTGSVGLMQRGADVTELLEKQADLIQYLQQKQQNLNQKIMQMSQQLRTVTLGPHPTV